MAVNHFAYEKKLNLLINAYKQAAKTIAAQINAAMVAGNLERAQERVRQAAEVQQVLAELGATTDTFAREIVQDAYYQSAQATAAKLPTVEVSMGVSTFNSVSREAVDALAESLVDGLRISRLTVARTADKVFSDAAKQEVLQGLLGAQGSRRKVSKRIVERLQTQGKTAFVDKAGKRWTLENYAEMSARTITREAVTQGATNRMASQGIEYCQVSTHSTSCPICLPHEGNIMRLDGTEDETTTAGLALPPFHPNCKHVVLPYIKGLSR